jgi:PAS domain S-box-containing protein
MGKRIRHLLLGCGWALLTVALATAASLLLKPLMAHRVSLAACLAVGTIIVVLTVFLRSLRRRVAQRNAAMAEVQEQLRQRMEQLADGEARVRSVIDHVIDGIITITEQGLVETFNPAAEHIFGYRADEVVGQNIKMLMPGPYREHHDQYLSHYMHTGQAKIIGIGREVVGRRKDGSTFPMDLAVSEFRLQQRRMFAGIVRDVSERKRAEQTFKFLADASTTLAALVDFDSTLKRVARLAVPFFADWCAVDMLEADGSVRRVAIVHSDPAKVEQTRQMEARYPLGALTMQGALKVVRSGRSELVTTITEATLAEFAQDEEHLKMLRGFGLTSFMCVPLEVRGKLLGALVFADAESRRHYAAADLTVAEDLAHRAAVAIENARLYAEVKEGDRRKDEFLAMLAHELRNPLAPIRSGLDLLGMEGCDAETASWARTMMQQQVQHMVRLVDDLLDVSRIMRGKIQLRKERVSLADVVARGVETARPLIDAQKHELVVSLPKEPVWLEADPVRMAQVLTNLLNNAAKYNDKPGHILLSGQCKGDEVIVRVLDDGMGIDAALLPRVFDLFTQADRSVARSQGGLGIGLTLVRSLVEKHGGSVQAFSEGPGKGSEFVIRLPALQDKATNGNGNKPEVQSHLGGAAIHRRVLVVDDNVDAARTFAEIATLWKHDVRVAYNGTTALELANSYHPDVVLLDIGLPGMSGYQVARQLRRQPEFAKTMIVAVTGYGQEEDRGRSRAAGFNHHLVKPVAPDVLQELLNLPTVRNDPSQENW